MNKRFFKKRKKLTLAKRIVTIMLALIAVSVTGFSVYALSKENPKSEQKEELTLLDETKVEPSVKAVIEEPKVDEAVTNPSPKPEPQPEPVKPVWPVTYTSAESSLLSVVVNKKHKLPSSYTPALKSVNGGQLRPEAAGALETLLTDASNSGLSLKIISSYRSYQTQVNTYNKWVAQDGVAAADRYSARAGHSEHQTGLAVDLGRSDGSCDLEICFGSTAEGHWLSNNAIKYGFIIRYESNTESITGYQYEPWHLRYIGVNEATLLKNSGKTLDQYFGVEAGGY